MKSENPIWKQQSTIKGVMAVPEFYLVISYKLQRQTCLDFL